MFICCVGVFLSLCGCVVRCGVQTKGPMTYAAKAADHLERTSDNLLELKDLLDEAGSMPVFMEETVVLRTHLNILQWAQKAKVWLPASLMWPDRPEVGGGRCGDMTWYYEIENKM